MGESERTDQAAFCTTAWTTILNAKDENSADYYAALQKLCSIYWFPLYAYARRKRLNPHDAQDSVQAFFESFIEREFLCSVERHKGMFRSFLVTAFNRFLMNQFAHANRIKRGGRVTTFSIDAAEAEGRFADEPSDEAAPDKLFDKNWAEALIEAALGKLRDEFARVGEVQRFELLKLSMLGHMREEGYAELGVKLALSEGGVKTVVRRMRLRFSALLREELLQTISNPDDLESELRYLLDVLR